MTDSEISAGMAESSKNYNHRLLEDFTSDALLAAGATNDHARIISQHIVAANLTGTDSHGIFRLPSYISSIRKGQINVRPEIKVTRGYGAIAVVNGDNGMGHLVMDFSAHVAIDKPKENGIAWVGVNHSNHAGAGAVYANIVRDEGMIGIYMAVAGANLMAPWGGKELLLGTNPIAVAVPTRDMPHIVLDMATSVASMGKIMQAAKHGESILDDWLMDDTGRPITDPNLASKGLTVPIGGPKGYGLALIIGVLGGTLNGANFGREVKTLADRQSGPSNTGQTIVALSIDAFYDLDSFTEKSDQVFQTMKSSEILPGFDEVKLPGERSHKEKSIRLKSGIPIQSTLLTSLDELAKILSIEPLDRR